MTLVLQAMIPWFSSHWLCVLTLPPTLSPFPGGGRGVHGDAAPCSRDAGPWGGQRSRAGLALLHERHLREPRQLPPQRHGTLRWHLHLHRQRRHQRHVYHAERSAFRDTTPASDVTSGNCVTATVSVITDHITIMNHAEWSRLPLMSSG